MAKTVLTAHQASQILAIIARELGSEVSLSKAIAALGAEPKRELAFLFTDRFGNVDVKTA